MPDIVPSTLGKNSLAGEAKITILRMLKLNKGGEPNPFLGEIGGERDGEGVRRLL